MSTPQEQLKRFSEAYKVFTESVTKTEFEQAFKVLYDFVLQIKKRNEEEMRQMEQMHSETMTKLEGDTSGMIDEAMEEMKKKMMAMCEPMMKEMYAEHEEMMKGMEKDSAKMKSEHAKEMKDHENEMKFIYDKVQGMKSGNDGKDADEEVIVGKVLAKIPESKEETPEEIRGKLESLTGEKRLDSSAIKGLEEEIKELRTILSNIPRGRSMGRARVPITRAQNLTSQVDGVVNTFTLDPDTTAVFGVFSTQFPVNFNAGTDWTFAGRTLTLVTAQVGVPQSGQTLWVLSEVLFSP